MLVIAVAASAASAGGLTRKAGSPALRARFTAPQIQGFCPPTARKESSRFRRPTTRTRFDSPTPGLRRWDDCLWYVGYSYWRNTNNHVGSTDMYIFLGTDPNRGGVGPMLIRYNKTTDDVQNLARCSDRSSPYHCSTGEGWYFSGTQPTKLYTICRSAERSCGATTS